MGINDGRTASRERAQGFDALYAAIAPDIARYAYLLTASPTRAAHVTHHVFAIAWRDLPEVTDPAEDAPRLRTLAGDLALNRRFLLRRAMWRLVPHPDRTGRVVPHADDDAHREQAIALLRALQRVRSHRRRVFVLRHLFGLTPEQVAAETEATTETTRLRLLHAHEDLAERVPALTGPSPNCPEAHRFLTTITCDLAARYKPRGRRPQLVRTAVRTRTAVLVVVVAAAIGALLVAAIPPLLKPGTSHSSRAESRIQAVTGKDAERPLPPLPDASDASEAPVEAAPPESPAAPPEPEPPIAPSPAAHLAPPMAPVPPAAQHAGHSEAAPTAPLAPSAPWLPTAVSPARFDSFLAPVTRFTLDTSCVNDGVRRTS
ncbi:RNA polymerase sigma factor [Embleya sp. NBC_00896]|uniref:RNA polymerase sigma factor n=1 Tax=Embleya sp. NBC_00896 TaxID=2975961 RepID=UPI00386F6455|nr:hypothetical protein OG928_13105 [Embleya sp. NBC_00896]